MTLTFDGLPYAWWPYVFILVAGVLATDIWRWLGVFAGGALREDSEALIWVKAVATALIAGIVGQLILFPSGELASTPVTVRIAAAAIGWAAFAMARGSVLVGVLAGEAALFVGWTWLS